MPDIGPGDLFLLLLVLAIFVVTSYTIYRTFNDKPSSQISINLRDFYQVETPMTWCFSLVNTGRGTAKNVHISAREYNRSQIPLTEPNKLCEVEEWRPDQGIEVDYTIEDAESVWLQLEIEGYRFEDQIRFRLSIFGELERVEHRFS